VTARLAFIVLSDKNCNYLAKMCDAMKWADILLVLAKFQLGDNMTKSSVIYFLQPQSIGHVDLPPARQSQTEGQDNGQFGH